MALPKIDYPVHEIYLKSLDRKVKFRPFLVREEKILLVAKESENKDDVKTAIKQIIQNCCLEQIDVDKLPLFDIEMFFIYLRAKSIGENARLSFTCKNKVDGVFCDHVSEYSIDVSKVTYEVPEGHTNRIKITDKIGVVFKYPTINIDIDAFASFYETTLAVFRDNIDYIYDEDSMYYKKDIEDEELEEFLNDLSVDHIESIRNFFMTSPRVVIEDKIICEKCGYKHELVVENIYSFFT